MTLIRIHRTASTEATNPTSLNRLRMIYNLRQNKMATPT